MHMQPCACWSIHVCMRELACMCICERLCMCIHEGARARERLVKLFEPV